MKKYVKQIFEEGLGASLYSPIEKKIKKNFSGTLERVLIYILKFLYIILISICVCALFYYGFPFK